MKKIITSKLAITEIRIPDPTTNSKFGFNEFSKLSRRNENCLFVVGIFIKTIIVIVVFKKKS